MYSFSYRPVGRRTLHNDAESLASQHVALVAANLARVISVIFQRQIYQHRRNVNGSKSLNCVGKLLSPFIKMWLAGIGVSRISYFVSSKRLNLNQSLLQCVIRDYASTGRPTASRPTLESRGVSAGFSNYWWQDGVRFGTKYLIPYPLYCEAVTFSPRDWGHSPMFRLAVLKCSQPKNIGGYWKKIFTVSR